MPRAVAQHEGNELERHRAAFVKEVAYNFGSAGASAINAHPSNYLTVTSGTTAYTPATSYTATNLR